MKVENIAEYGRLNVFKGNRVYRNTVEQLVKNNEYSLSEPNQRRIAEAIKALGQVKGSKNVDFLLNAAANVKYQTHIAGTYAPKNNWKAMLLSAAAAAAALTSAAGVGSLISKIIDMSSKNVLTDDEVKLMELSEKLLKSVDLEQIEKEGKVTEKNFKNNLNYFVISSETTTEHKKYVLERLNYLMSDDYSINPQLKNKKSLIAAEMLNDMVIHTPDSKIPNIKAINQSQLGICAAISVVRKMLAYEDKPNYVDSILSELNSEDVIEVYDRTNLGSKQKIQLQKIPIDFESAIANGYRIIDASVTQWMQLAKMKGASSVAYSEYYSFNPENFDVMNDSFFDITFDDPELAGTQIYYQSLVHAMNVLSSFKTSEIFKNQTNREVYSSKKNNMKLQFRISELILFKLEKLFPEVPKEEIRKLVAKILSLQKKYSIKIPFGDKYSYIPNEEEDVKKSKIKSCILENSSINSISDKDIDEIYELVSFRHGVVSSLKSPKKAPPYSELNEAYQAAAAFRYAVIKGLKVNKTLENIMISENIPNRESLVCDTFDKLISMLENGSDYSDEIVKQLSKTLQEGDMSKNELLNELKTSRNEFFNMITNDMDDIYASMLLGNRKTALSNFFKNVALNSQKSKPSDIKELAAALKVHNNRNAVIKKLNDLSQKVINCDEKTYSELNDIIQRPFQFSQLENMYKNFEEGFENMKDEEILAFLEHHNISNDDCENAVVAKLEEIKSQIEICKSQVEFWGNTLKVLNPDGSVLISADPEDVIIKKLENENRLVSRKVLKKVQKHLNEIAKYRVENDSISAKTKMRNNALTNLTKEEQAFLKDTKESINAMFSYLKKQQRQVKSSLGNDLETLKRIVGVNNGKYYISENYGSGLFANNQVAVAEYITGRPYYIEKDIEKAIDEIKSSPYSGISSSSVYHDRIGMHAQYIADIEPVKIKVKDKDGNIKEETKDILFNDNSWGATEHNNYWTDSYGLKRTDYGSAAGGTLGYITNSEYRNGNLVDRIKENMTASSGEEKINNKVYKRLKRISDYDEGYSTSQYTDVILQGKPEEAEDMAEIIHDDLFASDGIKKFERVLGKLSEAEVSAKLKEQSLSTIKTEDKYNELYTRIFPTLGKGIEIKEDYDKLPEDDYLKLALEKTAANMNYFIYRSLPLLINAKKVSDIEAYRKAQREDALNNFNYSFGKDAEIFNAIKAVDFISDEEIDGITKLLEKYGIKLTDKELDDLCVLNYDEKTYDGSMKTTIDTLSGAFNANIDKLIKDSNAAEELKKYIRDMLERNYYFNKEDLNKKEIKTQIKFIDRIYNPYDDDEFTEIYRKIQDMTEKEYKEKILSEITDEDLGIKQLTGYDVLKKLRIYDENYQNMLYGTIYYDLLGKDFSVSKPAKYAYKKYTKKLSTVIPKEDFGSLYKQLLNKLTYLNLEKVMLARKDNVYRKYDLYPAYPKIEYITEDFLHTSYDALISVINENVGKIKGIDEQLENYSINNRLKRYMEKLDPTQAPSEYQYKNINKILGRFTTINYGDTSLSSVLQSAENLMLLPFGTPWSEYAEDMQKIIKQFNDFQSSTSADTLKNAQTEAKLEMDANINSFANVFVQKRYSASIREICNRYKQTLIKQRGLQNDSLEQIKEELYNEFSRNHVIRNPKELLERYAKAWAKDSSDSEFRETYKVLLERLSSYSKLFTIQRRIMEAISGGYEIKLKDAFKDISVEMNNNTSKRMSDGQIIYDMVNRLVLDGNMETAVMFLENLGLAEQYITFTTGILDFDSAKKDMERTTKLVSNIQNFKKNLDKKIVEYCALIKNDKENFIPLINKFRNEVKKLGKQYHAAGEYMKMILQSADNIIATAENNPQAQEYLIFDTIATSASNSMYSKLSVNIKGVNENLESLTTFVNLMNSVLLRPDCEADKLRQEATDKLLELKAIKDSQLQFTETE